MVITVVALLLFAGLFFGALILCIVLAVSAKTTGGRVAAIVCGLAIFLGVPVVFLMMSLVAYRSAEPATATVIERSGNHTVIHDSESIRHPRTPLVAPGNVSLPPVVIDTENPLAPADDQNTGVWRTSDTETFSANLYPSFDAAIRSMVVDLRETLIERQTLYRDEKNEVINPDTIVVTAVGSKLEPLVPEMTQLIGKQFPGTSVRSEGKVPAEPTKDQLSIHFVVSEGLLQQAPWDQDATLESGELTCIVQASLRQTTLQSFVSEKPWVEGFDRFVSQYPKRNFIVGYSSEFQSTEGQAMKSALSDASRQASISVHGNSYTVIDGRHVVDRFAQRLTRSYGDVWREAVLVEIPNAAQIGQARTTVVQQFQRSKLMSVSKQFGIAILVIVTILLCLLLNWVTKGYYRSQVLLGLTGVIVFGLLVLGVFVA